MMSTEPGHRSPAQVKALASRLAEVGPSIIFGSGKGRGDEVTSVVVDLENGKKALVYPLVPPVGASDELLLLYSARATANIKGRCPLCDAVTGLMGQDSTGVTGGEMMHDADCPVSNDLFVLAARAHWAVGPYDRCPCGSGQKFKFCHKTSLTL